MARRGGVNISFLDVFCCAMGAAIVLAVLFSVVKNPVQIPVRGQFLLLEMTMVGDVEGPGVSVTTPRNETFDFIPDDRYPTKLGRAARDAHIWEAKVIEGGSNHTRVYFEVRDPIEGKWQLSPTMPRWSETNGAKSSRFADVKLWTRDGLESSPKKADPLSQPGQQLDNPFFRVNIGL